MNLTVGPLSPAVYWRRRALVLGAVLLSVLLIATMCAGSGDDDSSNPLAAHSSPSETPDSSSPTPQGLAPIIGGDPASSGSADSGSPAPNGGPPPPPGESTECSDAEIVLTPSVVRTVEGKYTLGLKVRNVSHRTCSRNVDADAQELRVVQNNQIVWSSDSCQTVHNQPDIRTFAPNIETMFSIAWDGSIGPQCTSTTKVDGPFQVVAVLGNKASNPVPYPPGG
jgi:hypothetical protein